MDPLSHGAGCQQQEVFMFLAVLEIEKGERQFRIVASLVEEDEEEVGGGSAYNSCNKRKQMLCNLLLGIS